MSSSPPPTLAPKFDPALPVSSWLWPKFQAYLATQQAAAAKRPKSPPVVRFLLALPVLVFLGDLVGVTFFGLSNTLGLQILAVSIAPRILLEAAALAGLLRRDLLGQPQSSWGFGLSLVAWMAFLIFAFLKVPFWFLPAALLVIYAPLLWKGYRRIRLEILADRPVSQP